MKLSTSALVIASCVLSAAARISVQEIQEKSAKGLHLIDLAEDAEPVWKTDDEVFGLIANNVKFFDVTETYDANGAQRQLSPEEIVTLATYPAPSHQTQVKSLLSTLSLPTMQSYLNNLTSFNNRYYQASTGQQASVWIRDTVQGIINAYPTSRASVALYPHSWTQNSIIAKIPGTSSGPVTILGGHMDSVNGGSPTSGRAPGADDDGSGTSNLLEAFRALVTSGFRPSTPIEFHWYSGEEGGLKGSQAIATAYKSAGTQVKAMLQFDMTAYVKPGTKPVVGLMPDYTDAGLTTFVGQLVNNYLTIPWVTNEPCGYACSDHASWNRQGYPTALPFESLFSNDNPNIHKATDTISVSGFNFTHSFEFAKLALAFAYELALIIASCVLSAAARITVQEIQEKSAQGLHLIDLAEDVEPVWKTEKEVEELIAQEIGFFDVTETYDVSAAGQRKMNAERIVALATCKFYLDYQSQVRPLLNTVSLTTMQRYLNNLTSFNNRYYTASSGQQASVWIRDTVQSIINAYPTSGATVSLYSHSWLQPSIIARIPGRTSGPVTVLGGHMDSINSASASSGRAPGADDDGSGSSNLLEAFRVLVTSGFRPSTPIEFQWYAAEEVGLRGSQAIATAYKNAGTQVKAMLQLDMTAYVKPGTRPVVALMPDYTDAGLNTFVTQLVSNYLTIPAVTNQACGYACSDHASWHRQGFPAALPFEGLFSNSNPNIHKTGDTINVSGFNFTHSLEFAKLAVAFAYELGA
ncbi:hypothetical protein CVT24_011376 [Panaeolus cyanescens]|uniref:Peptide hydrolase n=1 Tax=Panaeolus cyanescens TaxID=181874 RepID=A0A409VG04_9AGAR|nr:hypothetical protein CVT24_011376 [Panaeolus cyanescens]